MLFEIVQVTQPVDFILVTCLLITKTSQFVDETIEVFLQTVGRISFLLAVTARGVDLSLTTRNLLTGRGNFCLKVCISTIFLVKQESSVINLFSQTRQGNEVTFMSGFEVVVL